MGNYREHALEGASAVDLVVALYDGIIRFLYAAIDAVERGDVGRSPGRSEARTRHHHSPAGAVADGYGRQAGRIAQPSFMRRFLRRFCRRRNRPRSPKFEHAIDCVRTVRDAWREVASGPEANPGAPGPLAQPASQAGAAAGINWTA